MANSFTFRWKDNQGKSAAAAPGFGGEAISQENPFSGLKAQAQAAQRQPTIRFTDLEGDERDAYVRGWQQVDPNLNDGLDAQLAGEKSLFDWRNNQVAIRRQALSRLTGNTGADNPFAHHGQAYEITHSPTAGRDLLGLATELTNSQRQLMDQGYQRSALTGMDYVNSLNEDEQELYRAAFINVYERPGTGTLKEKQDAAEQAAIDAVETSRASYAGQLADVERLNGVKSTGAVLQERWQNLMAQSGESRQAAADPYMAAMSYYGQQLAEMDEKVYPDEEKYDDYERKYEALISLNNGTNTTIENQIEAQQAVNRFLQGDIVERGKLVNGSGAMQTPEEEVLEERKKNSLALADLEREEREQRERDDARAGALLRQRTAQEQLQGLIDGGAIEKTDNTALRTDAETALEMLKEANENNEQIDAGDMDTIQAAIDALRRPEEAGSYAGQDEGLFKTPFMRDPAGTTQAAWENWFGGRVQEAMVGWAKSEAESAARKYQNELNGLEPGTQEYEDKQRQYEEARDLADKFAVQQQEAEDRYLPEWAQEFRHYMDGTGPVTFGQDFNNLMTGGAAVMNAFAAGFVSIPGTWANATRGLFEQGMLPTAIPRKNLAALAMRDNAQTPEEYEKWDKLYKSSPYRMLTENPILKGPGYKIEGTDITLPSLQQLHDNLMKDAEGYSREFVDRGTERLTQMGVDEDTARQVLTIAVDKVGIGGFENAGRILPSLMAGYGAQIDGFKWMSKMPGPLARIGTKMCDAMSVNGAGFTLFSELGEAFQDLYEKHPEDATYWDYLMADLRAFGTSIVEYYDIGLGSGVQGARKFTGVRQLGATVLQETYEENVQDVIRTGSENVSDFLSGRDPSWKWEISADPQAVVSVSRAIDISVDTIFSTLGMEFGIAMGGGRGGGLTGAAMKYYRGEQLTEQEAEAVKTVQETVAATEEEIRKEDEENAIHYEFQEAMDQHEQQFNTPEQQAVEAKLRQMTSDEAFIRRAVNGELNESEKQALRIAGVEEIDQIPMREAAPEQETRTPPEAVPEQRQETAPEAEQRQLPETAPEQVAPETQDQPAEEIPQELREAAEQAVSREEYQEAAAKLEEMNDELDELKKQEENAWSKKKKQSLRERWNKLRSSEEYQKHLETVQKYAEQKRDAFRYEGGQAAESGPNIDEELPAQNDEGPIPAEQENRERQLPPGMVFDAARMTPEERAAKRTEWERQHEQAVADLDEASRQLDEAFKRAVRRYNGAWDQAERTAARRPALVEKYSTRQGKEFQHEMSPDDYRRAFPGLKDFDAAVKVLGMAAGTYSPGDRYLWDRAPYERLNTAELPDVNLGEETRQAVELVTGIQNRLIEKYGKENAMPDRTLYEPDTEQSEQLFEEGMSEMNLQLAAEQLARRQEERSQPDKREERKTVSPGEVAEQPGWEQGAQDESRTQEKRVTPDAAQTQSVTEADYNAGTHEETEERRPGEKNPEKRIVDRGEVAERPDMERVTPDEERTQEKPVLQPQEIPEPLREAAEDLIARAEEKENNAGGGQAEGETRNGQAGEGQAAKEAEAEAEPVNNLRSEIRTESEEKSGEDLRARAEEERTNRAGGEAGGESENRQAGEGGQAQNEAEPVNNLRQENRTETEGKSGEDLTARADEEQQTNRAGGEAGGETGNRQAGEGGQAQNEEEPVNNLRRETRTETEGKSGEDLAVRTEEEQPANKAGGEAGGAETAATEGRGSEQAEAEPVNNQRTVAERETETGAEDIAARPADQSTQNTAGEGGRNEGTGEQANGQNGEGRTELPDSLTAKERQRRENARTVSRNLGLTASAGQAGVVINTWDGTEVSESQQATILAVNDYVTSAERRGANISVVFDAEIKAPDGRGANGYYTERDRNGRTVIHIAQDAQNPYQVVFGHELGHMLEEVNPEGYQRLWDTFSRYAAKAGLDITALEEEMIRKHRTRDGRNLLGRTDGQIRKAARGEVLANSLYDVVNMEGFLREAASNNRGVLQRIGEWIDKVRADIRNMLNRYVNRTPQARALRDIDGAMEAMRREVDRAVREIAELEPAKKAVAQVGSNSQTLGEYQEKIRDATSRKAMNGATREMAWRLLNQLGVKDAAARSDSVNRLLSAAMLKAGSGMTVSQAMQAAGLEVRWDNSAQNNRAFMALAKYARELMESNDTDAYQQLFDENLDRGGQAVTLNADEEAKKRRKKLRNPVGQGDIYSLMEETPGTELDEEYRKAVESGNEEEQRRLVDLEADENGFETERAYHGTDTFGFTLIDMKRSQGQIFVAFSEDLARTYGYEAEARKIGKSFRYNYENLNKASDEEMARAVEDFYSDETRQEEAKAYKTQAEYRKALLETVDEAKSYMPEQDFEILSQMLANYTTQYDEMPRSVRWALEEKIKSTFRDIQNRQWKAGDRENWLNAGRSVGAILNSGLSMLEKNETIIVRVGPNGTAYDTREGWTYRMTDNSGGIYEMYTRPGKQLVVDAQGANWNDIHPEWDRNGKGWKTREIGEYAKEHGYDSVRINNVYDDGGKDANMRSAEAFGDIGIFFRQEDVKSADLVTYDDKGRVIPLSERFTDDPDIRFSVMDEGIPTEAEYIRYSRQDGQTADEARDEFLLHNDIARNDQNAWGLIRGILDIQRRRTQNRDGSASEQTGHWKKGFDKTVKAAMESVQGYPVSEAYARKLLRGLYEDIDNAGKRMSPQELVEFALREAQDTARDMYIGDRQENQLKEDLKAFFAEHGALHLGPEELSALKNSSGGALEFRNKAAGIVKITGNKGAIGIEQIYQDMERRFGLEEADNPGTQILQLEELLDRARSVHEIQISDEEYQYLNRVALDLVAEYMLAGQSAAVVRTTERMDTEEQRQLVLENERLQQRIDEQEKEIADIQAKADEYKKSMDFYAERGKESVRQLAEMKKQGLTPESMKQAAEGFARTQEELLKAQKDLKETQKKLEAARQKRDEYRWERDRLERQQLRSDETTARERRLQKQLENAQQKLKDANLEKRAALQKARAQAMRTEKRRKSMKGIRETNAKLRKMVASPSEAAFVPQELVRPAADLAEALANSDGRKAAQIGPKLARAIADARNSSDYATQIMFGQELQEGIDELTRTLEDKGKLRNLTDDELERANKLLISITHQMQNAGQTIGRQRNAKFLDEGAEIIRDNEAHPTKAKDGAATVVRRYLQQHLRPESFYGELAHHEDNAMARLGEDQKLGQRKQERLVMEATKLAQPLTEGDNAKKFDKFTGKHAIYYDTGIQILDQNGRETGRTMKLNGAERASLYMHWRSEENRRGMEAGLKDENGETLYQLTIPDEELMKKGQMNEAIQRGYRAYMSASQIQAILDEMTDYEKAWCDVFAEMEEKIFRPAINETSLKLNGFRKAVVEKYFPIFRDKNFVGKDFESVVLDNRLTSQGFLKERVNAKNPMLLLGITDVMAKQIDGVSRYYGMAIPIRDATMILHANMPGYADSVKQSIIKYHGTEAWGYIEKLMKDLQGGNKTQSSVLDKMRSAYAGAVLTLNPSVIIKQSASYFGAAAVLGWGAINKASTWFARTRSIDTDLIDTYTAGHWLRRTQNLSGLEANANRNTPLARGLHRLGNGIQAMDIATTKVLWKAAEIWVRDNTELRPGTQEEISAGTDAYYRKVAEMYDQALEQTQPEYGTFQRPGILRNESQLVKSMTMFKTQAMQNFNILFDAATTLRDKAETAKANPESAVAQQAYREAKTQLARAVSSQITSAVVLAIMTMLGKALLHKMRDYEDEKGDMTAESVGAQLLQDSLSSMSGMVAGGSELFDLINGLIEGQSPFDIEAAGISTINDLYQNTYSLLSAAQVIGDGDLTARQKWDKMQPKLMKFAGSVSQMYGIPLNNVLNLVDGIAANAKDFAAGKPGSFQESGISFIGKAQGRETSNKAVAGYIGQAMMDGNQPEAARLYNEQLRQGKSADSLNQQILAWQKENIPEIRQAAEAIDAGDVDLYNRLINEAVEKGVSMANAVKLAESLRKAKRKAEQDAQAQQEQQANVLTWEQILEGMTTESTEKSYGKTYTNGMMNSLLEDGDVEAALQVKQGMIEAGKKESAINSSLTSYWKERLIAAYEEGDMVTVRQITERLTQMGLDRSKIQSWTSTQSTQKLFGTSAFSGGFGTSKKTGTKSSGFGSGAFSGGFGKKSGKNARKSGFGSGTFGGSF